MSIKILSIGNSFSEDTMAHTAEILKDIGICDFKLGNLYIGGCSINRHYKNITNDIADYIYYTNTGDGWNKKEKVGIAEAIRDAEWDIISIQHGTGDKSRYTSEESYQNLAPLIDFVKSLAKDGVKIAFNMAWVAEPDSTHHEIVSYGGDQALMYKNLTALTENVVAPLVDIVSPVGTAVQNARMGIEKKLTRDDFHLSFDLGRYIGGLTFLKALCGCDIDGAAWCPDGVSEEEREIAKKAASLAILQPYAVTSI